MTMKSNQRVLAHSMDYTDALNRATARVSGASLHYGNEITLLHNGSETFEDWLTAIRNAEHWVHLENYIFKADAIGQRFATVLAERAAAGVAVRVLYDWFGSLHTPRSFWQQLRAAGVDVRAVNPPTVGEPLGTFRRDHRKFLGVDGTYASLGGVCIADEWLQTSSKTGLPYRDTAVRVCGPAIADLEYAFAQVWNEFGEPLPRAEQPNVDQIPHAGDTAARIIIQEPGKLRIMRMLQLVTALVQQRLWIADAYFLSTPQLTQALMAAAKDGVDVRLLVPATNDLPIVGALSRTGYRQFLQAGVRIYEYGGLMMHAKTTVADGRWSRVGSTNLNFTGLLTNWELDVFVEDERFGAEMERIFEADLEHAREIRLGRKGQRTQVKPERRMRPAERRRYLDWNERRSHAVATATRVSTTALQSSGDYISRYERYVGSAISGGIFAASLLILRFPRVLAWPLGLLGSILGGIGMVRSLRGFDTDGAETDPVESIEEARYAGMERQGSASVRAHQGKRRRARNAGRSRRGDRRTNS